MLIICVLPARSQDTWQAGLLPALHLSKGLNRDWRISLKAEARILSFRGLYGGSAFQKTELVLSDYALSVSRKIGLNNSLSGGYMIRLRDGVLYHRFSQQFTLIGQLSVARLAHRFLADETFSTEEPPEFRARYRLTGEIPLQGASLDPGEWYVKPGAEMIAGWSGGEFEPEVRGLPMVGYEITDNNKLEAGVDYRLSSFTGGSSRSSYWFSLNWYIRF